MKHLLTAVVLCALAVGTTGCSSQQELLDRARHRPKASDRREALLRLYDRAPAHMRIALEEILATEQDAAMRAIAARMLGRIRSPESAPELIQTIRADRSWVPRADAVSALARIQGQDSATELERSMLSDPDPQVRVRALKELAALPSEDLLAAQEAFLMKALADPDAIVRLKAAARMEELTGRKAAPDAAGWRAANGG